jgi:hypothetical protein
MNMAISWEKKKSSHRKSARRLISFLWGFSQKMNRVNFSLILDKMIIVYKEQYILGGF